MEVRFLVDFCIDLDVVLGWFGEILGPCGEKCDKKRYPGNCYFFGGPKMMKKVMRGNLRVRVVGWVAPNRRIGSSIGVGIVLFHQTLQRCPRHGGG